MLTEFFTQNQLLLNIMIVIASLYLMAKAADFAVLGVSRYAQKLGLSDCIIGMLVIAVVSSMPEFIASVTGGVLGESGIAIGSLLGASLAGLGLVIGIIAIVHKKVITNSKIIQETNFLIWILLMLPFILMFDGKLSRIDGLIMIMSFIVYTIILWKKEGTFGKIKKDIRLKHLWKDGLIFSLSLVVILLTARYLVFSCMMIANMLKIPAYFLALTVIAIGATMPDIMIGLKSIKQKHGGIGYGNIIGSMVVHLLFLGIIVILTPLTFEISSFLNLIIIFVLMVTSVLIWSKKGFLTRTQGISLLIVYILFILIQLLVH